MGFKKFGEKKFLDKNGVWIIVAWIFIFMGIFFFILFLGNTILGFIYPSPVYSATECTKENYLYGHNRVPKV
jgi:hypothetical protein